MTPEEILIKKFNAEDAEDLQMSITLNPQLIFFIEAMTEYASLVAAEKDKEIADLKDALKKTSTYAATWIIEASEKEKELSEAKERIVELEKEIFAYGEWARVNGERHRGNLQKNGKQLYEQYLKEKQLWEQTQNGCY